MRAIWYALDFIGVGLITVCGLALIILLRRRWFARGVGSFDCCFRAKIQPQGKGWALGVARYNGDVIEWFRVFDLSPRPRVVLKRAFIKIEDRRTPTGLEAFAVMTDFQVLQCEWNGTQVELAMSEQSFTGFSSWLESAPPGHNMTRA